MEQKIQQPKTDPLNSIFNPQSKQDVVADYVASGYTLIKVSGKVPIDKAWQQTEYNMFQTADDFPQNYGVKLTPDLLVIDYDPRNDVTEGKQALQNLIKYLDNFVFDTYTVITGGNGLHIYMTKPPEISVTENLYKCKKDKDGNIISEEFKEYSGIEFKSVGRQVIGPLSIHPETNRQYKIAYHKPSYRINAPAKLLDLIKRTDKIVGIDPTKTALNKYTDDEQSVQRYKSFLKAHPPAVEGDGGDTHTYKTACRGRDFGLSPQLVFETMMFNWNNKCLPPWSDTELWVKVRSAFENNQDTQGKWNPATDFAPIVSAPPVGVLNFDRNAKTGEVKKSRHNVACFMRMNESPIYNLLRYNLFTENIEFVGKAPWHSENDNRRGWSDEDAIQFAFWLSEEKIYEANIATVHEAALKIAMDNAYHPVINYLDNLRWDGIPRIHNWLTDYAGAANNPYVQSVGEKTLMAAVARIYEPGIKFDHVLVLEGEQGIGKSTLVHTLGKNWYGDIIIDPHNKDTIDALRGKWIVEISEMECTRREVNALKRFISCTSDTVRLAYARTAKEFPRKSIFIGTINPEMGRGYLKDSTGNRRYWPVEIIGVDFDGLKNDVDQLWAEAVAKYKKGGAKLWIEDKNVRNLAAAEANKRYEGDPWEDIIEEFLESRKEPNGLVKEYVTAQEILDECLLIPHSKIDKIHRNRVTIVLGRLGWKYSNRRVEGKQLRCFIKTCAVMLDL